VRGADRIYVLERGQVVETGDWAQLMGAQGRFHAMALAQHMTA
jgi:ABC-type multidrug transport system fused ATPase/permease subunit